MGITYAGEGSETPLAVIPKNELAIVAKQAGDKADRLWKTQNRLAIGALSGFVIAVSAAATLTAAPVVAPVLLVAGIVSLLGSASAVLALEPIVTKSKNQRSAAIANRTSHLKESALYAIERAIEDDTIRVGLDLPIAPRDETPKKVRVENVSVTINAIGKKILSISANILEEDGTGVDWLNSFSSRVSLEQSVAAFPKAVLESIRTETSRAGASSTTEPQPRWHPEPPTVRKPEKSLPRGPITRYRGPT